MRNRLAALARHLRTEHADPVRLGWAAGLGVFVGVLPLYGLHTLICLALALALKLNKATLILASNISVPVVAPFLVSAGLALGEGLRFGRIRPVSLGEARDFLGAGSLLAGQLPDRFLSCLLGDGLLGLALGAIAGTAAYRLASRRDQRAA